MSVRVVVLLGAGCLLAAACVTLDGLGSANDAADAGDGGSGESAAPGSTADGGLEAAPADVDAGCGELVVDIFSDSVSTPDHQGVMAVAGGTPTLQMGPNTEVWAVEKTKTWYTLDNYIQFTTASTTKTVSVCVPPGDYTLQYWDIWGSSGAFDNGTPPAVTYVWQIGKSSRTVHAVGGKKTLLGLAPSKTDNVPTTGSFYGSWANWSYGPCEGNACPNGGTCEAGFCVDLEQDSRNCGSADRGCSGLECCNTECVDLGTTAKACGGCGNVCASQACSGAVCQ